MPTPLTETQSAARRTRVLIAARWCFLTFGFAKTTLTDIATRADLSRTLLYQVFNDKDAIYQAVFAEWIVARYPAARQAAEGSESPTARLFDVCRILALEPWAEMVGTPMGSEFLDVCARIDPENQERYRKAVHACVAVVLGDDASAEVFLLALDGLFADQPAPEMLERRTRLLVARFAPPSFDQEVPT